ncbi:ABC transporter substrate-binding protein [Caldimonas tepidiphila]|uniref:ABC transporter substrate-binding protein n=1 Tax=Caldimonas tepidiphila TaxID=2315841 RepID=UPI000E5B9009|nr:ABC transporter substrate-binding protein [Caldimonas tepidiphila]
MHHPFRSPRAVLPVCADATADAARRRGRTPSSPAIRLGLRLLRPLLAALAVGLATAGCSPAPEEPVLVGALRLPSSALLYLAEESGCLAGGKGPALVLRDYPSGRDALDALRRGEVQVAVAYQTPVALGAAQDSSLRILTSLHTGTHNTHLVARADRGVRVPADLRGKRIGLPPRTTAENFARTLLLFEGIDPGTVRFVDIAPHEAAAEIAAGRVDAVVVWSPHADAAAAALPPPVRVQVFSDVYTEASMLVTREPVRAARADALAKLVRCVADAARRLDAAPDRGLPLVRRLFPGQEAAQLARQWDNLTPQVGLQNALLALLHDEAEWLSPSPGPGGMPRFAELFAPEFIEAAEPDSVTYVRNR